MSNVHVPTGQALLSTFFLASAIWTVLFLVPRAWRERDLFGVTCAVLAAVVALLGWLLVAAPVR